MSLKHRLMSLERTLPPAPRRSEGMQSAFGLWRRAVEHDAPAWASVLGCLVERTMSASLGPYDTPLSDEQRKVFTHWAAGFEKKHGRRLEAARADLVRAGVFRRLREALQERLKR